MSGSERQYDVVLFGATSFVGRLTAEYLARSADPGLRWAIAGRNRQKLEELRGDLAAIDPALADLPVLVADSQDGEALAHMAESAKVVASTVGPYVEYGEPLVKACAEAGTDYCDLTGEPEFVDQMYLTYDEVARRTGARLVHACGFDSIPHDLGAFFTLKHVPQGVPVHLTGVVRANGTFSGGTIASALLGASRLRRMQDTARARRAKEPRPEGRKVRGRVQRPHRDDRFGYWLFPLPTIDPFIVVRSAAALPSYGPEFTYSHYAGMKRLRTVLGTGAGMGALMAVAQIGPLRRAVMNRFPAGSGPSLERRARSGFKVRFLAEAGDRVVRTEVSGGDPGYGETATMLAQSAQCLALDDNPPTSGQQTTVVAMGENLLTRLQRAGIRFEVVEGA